MHVACHVTVSNEKRENGGQVNCSHAYDGMCSRVGWRDELVGVRVPCAERIVCVTLNVRFNHK